MDPGSSAQKPEKLFRESGLIALVALLAALFLVMTFINIPELEVFTTQQYISVQ
jgi:ABC-type transporter Mla subunit MlaD